MTEQRSDETPSETGYACFTWFERDRQHVRLETSEGKEIFSLWDEDVTDAIESGYLVPPRCFRPTDADWYGSAVQYARDLQLIQ